MLMLTRIVYWLLLASAAPCCNAGETEHGITREQIDAHVRAQFQEYGPRSKQHEYFGYVYRRNGVVASAVMRGPSCSSPRNCGLDTEAAARLIPPDARVLGEWHTHPHLASSQLSLEDVRGAHSNVHIPGYLAYYSKPNGDIFAWDPRSACVSTAMSSAVLLGNYRSPASPALAYDRRKLYRR